MNTKPRDVCSAAFHGDTERLRQLVVAAGVYTGRWAPPCHISIDPLLCAAVDADVRGGGDGSDNSGGGGRPAAPEIISEEVADEMTEVLSEEEMTALLAHPELLRLTQAYTLEGLDDAEENGATAAGADADDDDGVDGELLDEGEEEEAEADRQAQQHDLLIFRCLFAEQRHRESLAQRLRQHGLLQVSVTPPVNMVSYGILFSCRERGMPPLHEHHHTEGEGEDPMKAAETPATALQVRWQPSRRSTYAGTPLHWAVLARSHAMVDFLVRHGADETAGLRCLSSLPSSNTNTDSSDSTSAAAKALAALTPSSIALANESLPTLQTLTAALDARDGDHANFTAFCAALEGRLERRKARYVQRRQMAVARRVLRAQQQREEDARAAAAAENEEGGEDVEEGDEMDDE